MVCGSFQKNCSFLDSSPQTALHRRAPSSWQEHAYAWTLHGLQPPSPWRIIYSSRRDPPCVAVWMSAPPPFSPWAVRESAPASGASPPSPSSMTLVTTGLFLLHFFPHNWCTVYFHFFLNTVAQKKEWVSFGASWEWVSPAWWQPLDCSHSGHPLQYLGISKPWHTNPAECLILLLPKCLQGTIMELFLQYGYLKSCLPVWFLVGLRRGLIQ